MKLLLTGATGFVGRNFLLSALRSQAYSNIMLPVRSREKLHAQLLGDGFDAIPDNIQTINWDAHDDFPIDIANIDHVVHTAGVLFGSDDEDYFATNVEGTVRLLRRISSCKKIVILSSQAAAGPSPDGRTRDEYDLMTPLTGYGRSKLEMERRIQAEFSSLPFVVLRPPMVLGARDHATLALFKIARYALRPKPGLQQKQYSYIAVDDLIDAIHTVLTSPLALTDYENRSFFVCHERSISDSELILTAGKTMGRHGLIVPIPVPVIRVISALVERVPSWRSAVPSLSRDRVIDIAPNRWVISPTLFENAFQWKARVGLARALQDARDWYSRSGQL